MSHLEKFIALYKEISVELKMEKREAGEGNEIGESLPSGFTLTIVQIRNGKKVGGYGSFFTTIYFDENGNFINQSFWE